LTTVDTALEAGASVTVCARTVADVTRVLESRQGKSIDGIAADVSRPDDVRALFSHATERFGKVDGVIHAAAVIGPIGRVGDVEADAWWNCVRVDLFGTFLIVAEACRLMEGRGGRIVLFSGGGATTPFPRYSAYASSKVAVARLVESVALEYAGSGIEINAVAPGFVATRMHDATLAAGSSAGDDYLDRTRVELAGGGVSPEVGARCACFLASRAASSITGKIIAAPWDDWEHLPQRLPLIVGTDIFTLRRIVPRDRGHDWQ